MATKKTLLVRGFTVIQNAGQPITIQAEFILPIPPYQNEEVITALDILNRMFRSNTGLDLVLGSDSPRCLYCGTKAGQQEKNCTNCGAVL